MITILVITNIVILGIVTYFIVTNTNEHSELLDRMEDLENAITGYCEGKLNGSYSRILKRQQMLNNVKSPKER